MRFFTTAPVATTAQSSFGSARLISPSGCHSSPSLYLPPGSVRARPPFDSRTAEWVSTQNKKPSRNGLVFCFGDPYGNRTHVFAVRGRCLSLLTNGPTCRPQPTFCILSHSFEKCKRKIRFFAENLKKVNPSDSERISYQYIRGASAPPNLFFVFRSGFFTAHFGYARILSA